MIIDLPAAESGSANWPALVALKLAITQRLLSRYTALHHGTPLSRRGVVIVQDERSCSCRIPKRKRCQWSGNSESSG
jgi:hypothetical protein